MVYIEKFSTISVVYEVNACRTFFKLFMCFKLCHMFIRLAVRLHMKNDFMVLINSRLMRFKMATFMSG